MQYRIVAATKSWHRGNYIIQKRSIFWPFWVHANDYSYNTIEDAKFFAKRLKTNIKL